MTLSYILCIRSSFNLTLFHITKVLRAKIVLCHRLVINLISSEVIVWLSVLLHSIYLSLTAIA